MSDRKDKIRISPESRMARKPQSPESLVDAVLDRVHQDDAEIRTDRRKRISERHQAENVRLEQELAIAHEKIKELEDELLEAKSRLEEIQAYTGLG